MYQRKNKWLKAVLGVASAFILLGSAPISVHAVSDNDISASFIDDDDRYDASVELSNYKESLIRRESPEQYIIDELNSIMYSGQYYIANSEKMTEVEMWTYVGTIKSQMDAAIGKAGEVTTTTEFLTLADNWQTPTVSYGQKVNIVLPLVNMGEEWLTDLLIEPEVTNDVATWPFVPDSTGYTQNFAEIPGCASRKYEEAFMNRREVTYTFTAREDVLTGYYPLKFKVWYSKEGIRCTEPAEVSVFVYCQGKPGSGRIGMSEESNVSQPRIIVTGFETDPGTVYAGDTFTLNIHVKNTSQDTAVNNVLFDLEAVEGGTENSNGTTTNSYAAFLPTSGSSAIYVERMPAGSSQDLKIEMQAKADLSQKPYVVTVKMKYDTDLKADLTDEAKVSIPVKQESKYDSSTPEINPSDIMVGEQSNVMFQIYNTGKTTLYNVQVKFEADSVEGGDTFIGNLAPGATGNVDAMVTGIAQTMDDGTVKAVILYEDEAGNQTREEKDITIYVNEMFMDEGMTDMPMMPIEEEKSGPSMATVIIIIAAVIVVAAAAAVGILKFRKKKKAAKQLAEDLLDLDKDE
ncbi:MAG: CARDB domain-containing protein [Eubacteriales bacterium]|nr:CARDB domain-containing protein [Eubacteriales bacterium]